jgi:hypothetical protein
MATIRKRNGRYQVQIRRQGQPTLSRTFSLRRDADAWARQMETEIERTGLAPDVSAVRTMTVGDILDRYLRTESPQKRSCEFDKVMIGHFLRQPFARLGVVAITPEHLEAYLAIRSKTVGSGTMELPRFGGHPLTYEGECLYASKPPPLPRRVPGPDHRVGARRPLARGSRQGIRTVQPHDPLLACGCWPRRCDAQQASLGP